MKGNYYSKAAQLKFEEFNVPNICTYRHIMHHLEVYVAFVILIGLARKQMA